MIHWRRAGWDSQSGLTLIELLLVLALIGLLTATAVPRLAAVLGGSPLEESVDAVVRSLRHARQDAVRTGRPRSVTLDGPDAPRLAHGVDVLPVGAEMTVVFYPTGMSAGGGWRLTDRDGGAATVRVLPITGSIRVER